MNILAFDTCFGACSAAVSFMTSGRQRIESVLEMRVRGHAEALLPMIRDVMAKAGLSFSDLHRIAVTTGPGTFMGLRTGVAAARGLALASGLPVTALGTLHVMARTGMARPEADGRKRAADHVAIAVAARRGAIYFQLFTAACRPLTRPVLTEPARAVAQLPEGPVYAMGSGAEDLAAAAARQGQQIATGAPALEPDAAHLALLAAAHPPGDQPIRPLYLRPPDARLPGKAL